MLEYREAQDADAEQLEDAVLQPRVQRGVLPVAEGEGLGEEPLLGLVVLDRAGSEQPDTDVEEGIDEEEEGEPHARRPRVHGPAPAAA